MKQEFDETDDLDYESYLKKLDNQTNEIKNKHLEDFNKNAEKYFNEIEKKQHKKNQEKLKYISFILKNSKNVYDESELLSYELQYIIEIYNEIREAKKPTIIKIFKFIFNV